MSTVLLTRGTHGVAAGGGLDLRPRWGGCRPKTVVVSGDPTLLPGHRSAWSQALLRKRGAEERGGNSESGGQRAVTVRFSGLERC